MTACHMGHSSKSFTNRPSTASSTESCKMESCWPTSLTQPFFWGGKCRWATVKKPGVPYFPWNTDCLMTGSLCHGLWNNLWGRITSTIYPNTTRGAFYSLLQVIPNSLNLIRTPLVGKSPLATMNNPMRFHSLRFIHLHLQLQCCFLSPQLVYCDNCSPTNLFPLWHCLTVIIIASNE